MCDPLAAKVFNEDLFLEITNYLKELTWFIGHV